MTRRWNSRGKGSPKVRRAFSTLVLASDPHDSDDGLLKMREMSELELHADLVVLSSCDTARGAVYAGEGVIGMSWALLTSGCPTTNGQPVDRAVA